MKIERKHRIAAIEISFPIIGEMIDMSATDCQSKGITGLSITATSGLMFFTSAKALPASGACLFNDSAEKTPQGRLFGSQDYSHISSLRDNTPLRYT